MSFWTTLILAATLTGDASCAAPAPGCAAKRSDACQPCSPRTPCSPCQKPCAVVNCHPCPQPVNPCSPCPATCSPTSCASSSACSDSCKSDCNQCCDPCCKVCSGPSCIPGSSCWSKACKHSTCDMYPHYAYFPKCHGYYYFRPYNWVHIDQHRLTIPGENFKNPYSNAAFDRLYAGKDNLGVVDSDRLEPVHERLPMLEDLLK